MNSPNSGFAPTSLSAVTCVSASNCWAIGRSEIGHTYANTTLMHWDGNSWQLVPSPSVENETNGLVDITCLSSSSCWAVGYHILLATVQVKTLVLHWDGTAWNIVPSPNVGDGFNALYGVKCTSESVCWAVGFENGGSMAQTLIEKWDGHSWTIQDSPNVGTEHNVLNAVTCTSASDCVAVGYNGMAGAKTALVARWNGNTWSASALPNQPLTEESTLTSVTCNSAMDCWAVGDSYNGAVHQTLTERWDGTSWTTTISPNGGADSYLSRVTCASGSDCWAVGYSNNATIDPAAFDQTLILHWNGTVWLPSMSPTDPTATYASDLNGVACASGSDCWAVGTIQPAGSGRSFIARWNGSAWSAVTAPDVPLKVSNFLDGVTCASESDCWAVGFDFYGVIARSLILHWNGATWSITDSPNTALDRSNYLSGVTCVSGTDCWIVGQSSNSLDRERQTLALHWDGAAWSVVSTSPADTSQALETALEAVACSGTADCWAVGFSLGQDYQAIIQHWDGSAWSPVPQPPDQDGTTTKSILYDVTCTGASDCTAVGVQWATPLLGSGLYQTLVEHWDGNSWSTATSPNTAPDRDNILSGVTCVTASDCWAVGRADRGNGDQTLILHWNGSAWSMADSPPGAQFLSAVTCNSATDCWAAGQPYSFGPTPQTYLVHWDGAAWSIVNSPNSSPTESNNLSAITCTSETGCFAVGQAWKSSEPQTLVLRFALPPPLKILSITHPAANTIHLECLGVPNEVNRVEYSTDLSSDSFQTLTSIPADATTGAFHFDDTNAGPKKFYRLAFP